jgi:hypothetical protein
MKLYKLTDQNQETQGGTKWDVGVTHSHKKCDDPQMCSGNVFHAYRNANLAFLLNPNHADISNPILWECEGEVAVSDWGKVGCFSLKISQRLPAPAWVTSNETRVRLMFAVLCAEAVLHIYETAYPQDDRPRKAIEAAKAYIINPSAALAARAANAARAAANAAAAYHSDDDASYAYYADANAAAVAYAAEANAEIDFCALADKAIALVKEMETTK